MRIYGYNLTSPYSVPVAAWFEISIWPWINTTNILVFLSRCRLYHQNCQTVVVFGRAERGVKFVFFILWRPETKAKHFLPSFRTKNGGKKFPAFISGRQRMGARNFLPSFLAAKEWRQEISCPHFWPPKNEGKKFYAFISGRQRIKARNCLPSFWPPGNSGKTFLPSFVTATGSEDLYSMPPFLPNTGEFVDVWCWIDPDFKCGNLQERWTATTSFSIGIITLCKWNSKFALSLCH